MEKTEWLEFIDRKINREYSRISYNGVTIWALVIALFAVANSFINSLLTQVDDQIYNLWYFVIVVIQVDLILILIMSYFSIKQLREKKKSINLPSKLMNNTFYYVFRAVAGVSLVVLFSNIVLLIIGSDVIKKWPFIFTSIIFLITIIANFLNAFMIKQQMKSRSNVPYIDGIPKDYDQSWIKGVILLVVVIGSPILCYNIIFSCHFPGDFTQLTQMILIGFKAVGCIVLLILILYNSYRDYYIRHLEAFEHLVLVNDYDSEEIFSLYKSVFIGFHLEEWIESQKRKIECLNLKIDKKYRMRDGNFIDEKNRQLTDLYVEIIEEIETVIDHIIELKDEKANVVLRDFKTEMEEALKGMRLKEKTMHD